MAADSPGSDRPALTVHEMLLDHDRKLDALLTWRSELRGAMTLVKITLGTSIVSGVAAIVAFAAMLSQQRPPTP